MITVAHRIKTIVESDVIIVLTPGVSWRLEAAGADGCQGPVRQACEQLIFESLGWL